MEAGYLIKMCNDLVDAMKEGKDENTMLALIHKYPVVMRIIDKKGKNLGMHAIENGYNKVAEMSLEDACASEHQDKKGLNIGMYAAIHKNKDLFLKALCNAKAIKQKSNTGHTMEEYGVLYGLIEKDFTKKYFVFEEIVDLDEIEQ